MRIITTTIWWIVVVFSSTEVLAQTTYYSRNGATPPRDWNEADSWTLSSDGSGAAASVPGRNDNVVILEDHTILINGSNDNGSTPETPNNLDRDNVGPFPGSNNFGFYQIGNITINEGAALTSSARLMLEGSTLILGTLTTTSGDDIINLGRLEISSNATLSCGDDFILSGNSETLLFNTSTSTDDFYIDNTDAQLCGTGSIGIVDEIQYFNGAALDQICSTVSITGCGPSCPTTGTNPSSLPTNQILIYSGAVWKYLDDGSDQGTSWRNTAFDDSDWEAGRAQLGYGDNDESTTVSFGGIPSNKHETTYFRKSFHVANPSDYSAVLLRLLRDDGAVVYINNIEVDRQNMPAGSINFDDFASSASNGFEEDQFFETSLSNSVLTAGTNYIAVEIHQNSLVSSDISFDLELIGLFGNNLINKGDTWMYLDDGSDQGTAWTGVGFDDSGWSSGPAKLGYGDDEVTVVGFGADPSNKHETTYLRKSFFVPDVSIYESLNVNILRDDGAVVYINGTEVLRDNMPAGVISFNTFASRIIIGADENNYNAYSASPSSLVNGTNYIAVEIHQRTPNSSDIGFDMELIGVEANALPVELKHFNGIMADGGILLDWATASEVNNDYFKIQRSQNGTDFFDLGIVDGNGMSQELINYIFIDSTPYPGMNYYRLCQVDFDEQQTYSSVISVVMKTSASYRIFPNPAQQTINIMAASDLTHAKVTLCSLNGVQQVIKTQIIDQILSIQLDQLPQGIYLIEIQYNEHVIKERIIIMPK